MEPETANAIYDICVKTCGASEGHRDQFVDYLTEEHDRYEFRFCGKLGFGGKLYHSRSGTYVSCYSEDETPERRAMIEKANADIRELLPEGKR